MIKVKADAIGSVIDILPIRLAGEIKRLALSRCGGLASVKEIRVRRGAACSMIIGKETLRLYSRVEENDADELVSRLIGGALYAHRESIASGYLSLPYGVRVGVCGTASYDNDRLVGVGRLSSIVFRIPTGECEFSEELYSIFRRGIGRGMLIYSPPGVGKTTALRSLARSVGGGRRPMRVCVVDERCEFYEGDYSGFEVDILRGYKRREGIEIATRTLSADLIMIDELGAADCDSILDVVRCGIPLVATAHADSAEEIRSKPALTELLSCSAFSVLVGISLSDGEYKLRVDEI